MRKELEMQELTDEQLQMIAGGGQGHTSKQECHGGHGKQSVEIVNIVNNYYYIIGSDGNQILTIVQNSTTL